jgi:hypothetical protein
VQRQVPPRRIAIPIPQQAKGKTPAKAAPAASSQTSSLYDSDSDDSTTKKKKKKKKESRGVWGIQQGTYRSARVVQTLSFVEALRARIDEVPATDRNKSLQFPLCEVGYSNRSIKHLKSHKAHASSNYIMNLLEAIFQVGGQFSSTFSIEQEIIYLVWNAEQVEVSEFGWTKLAESYIHSAGGFSLYPTGLSKDSAQKTTFRERDDSQEYFVEKTVYTKNLNRLVNMCKAEAEAWEE